MTPGRNEDCWCGSNRKYKHCHYRIDSATEDQKYAEAQAVYAQNWKGTAQAHYDNRVYHWLAEKLCDKNVKRILDIGCGSGHGLVALHEVLGADIQIIAIDENRPCIQEAMRTLLRHDIKAHVITRMETSLRRDGYKNTFEAFTVPADIRVILIESDIFDDPHLLPALQESGHFDAVTIWLTGTHMLRKENTTVKSRGIKNSGDYRLYIQNTGYELADKILRPSGLLQIADRTMAPDTPELIADVLQAHADQASITSMRNHDLTYQPYLEPNTRRTPMVVTPGTSGEVPIAPQLTVISIISVKS